MFNMNVSSLECFVTMSSYQGNEAEALEKLKQLESNCNSPISDSMSVKESKVASHPSPSLVCSLLVQRNSLFQMFRNSFRCIT